MTPDEVRQSITSWCSSDDDLEFAGDRFEPSTDFAVNARAGATSGAPVELAVFQGQGAARITIRNVASLSSGSADAANALLETRPGWVSGTADRGPVGTSVTVQTHVYLDGLNRHTFVQAASEVARTGRLLGKLATGVAAATATAQPAYASSVPASQPMAAPSFNPQPQQAQPVPAAQPVQQGPAPWVPTHAVPPQGLRAWAAPDPAGPVVANLAPGLPIQVAEVRGAWARVICSNGWAGWIDGRIIGVAA